MVYTNHPCSTACCIPLSVSTHEEYSFAKGRSASQHGATKIRPAKFCQVKILVVFDYKMAAKIRAAQHFFFEMAAFPALKQRIIWDLMLQGVLLLWHNKCAETCWPRPSCTHGMAFPQSASCP